MSTPGAATGPDSPSSAQAGQGLSREVGRVVGRLRSISLDHLPVDRVRVSAQVLADLAARASGEPARVVPELAPYAAADQIAVLTADVERAAGALDADVADALTASALEVLVQLRHAL